jgi:hypothetical protein
MTENVVTSLILSTLAVLILNFVFDCFDFPTQKPYRRDDDDY